MSDLERQIFELLELVRMDQLKSNAEIEAKLDKILNLFSPGKVASFKIALTSNNQPKDKESTMDFQINADGTATATITNPVDKLGDPATFTDVPTWTASDPTVLSLAPAADGLSCVVTPLKLGTGVTITAADAAANVTETSQAIDVTPGKVASFQISLQ